MKKPDRPERPSGQPAICASAQSTYTTSFVEGATNYTWAISANLNINTQSADQVSIVAPSFHSSETIQVQAENGCGKSELSEKLIVIIDPEPPAPLISGPADLCSGHAGVQYSTSADGVDSYGWIIPPSAKIKSAQADSSIIILDFPQGVPAMVIQSFSKGMCRTAVSKPYAVAITQPPATPTAIEGETELCATRETTTYSAPPELSGGTYTWSFPPGFNMTSSASNAVTVGISKQAKTGQISVTVSNACFTSAPMRLDVAILHEPEKPVISRGTCDRQLLYEGDDDVVSRQGPR